MDTENTSGKFVTTNKKDAVVFPEPVLFSSFRAVKYRKNIITHDKSRATKIFLSFSNRPDWLWGLQCFLLGR
jgi:hypothetical protein